MFLYIKNNLHYYIQSILSELGLLSVIKHIETTVLSTTKVPYFETWNYRTSTHTTTGLSNTYLKVATVLSTIKSITKTLKHFLNSYRKDVLKVDYKNNISVDDLFFGIKKGENQYE